MGYLLALAMGLLVGVAYALVGIRSPAPPVIALAGLLGMVLGEQGAPVLRQALVTALAHHAVRGDRTTPPP